MPVNVIAGWSASGTMSLPAAASKTEMPCAPDVCRTSWPGVKVPVALSPATRSASASSGTASTTRCAPATTSGIGLTGTPGSRVAARSRLSSLTADTPVTTCPARARAAPSTAPTRPAPDDADVEARGTLVRGAHPRHAIAYSPWAWIPFPGARRGTRRCMPPGAVSTSRAVGRPRTSRRPRTARPARCSRGRCSALARDARPARGGRRRRRRARRARHPPRRGPRRHPRRRRGTTRRRGLRVLDRRGARAPHPYGWWRWTSSSVRRRARRAHRVAALPRRCRPSARAHRPARRPRHRARVARRRAVHRGRGRRRRHPPRGPRRPRRRGEESLGDPLAGADRRWADAHWPTTDAGRPHRGRPRPRRGLGRPRLARRLGHARRRGLRPHGDGAAERGDAHGIRRAVS